MPPRKRKTSSSAVRGSVAVLFMIAVAIIYLFQERQGSGLQDVTPIAPSTGVTRSIPQAQRPAEDGPIAVFFTDPLSGASSGGIANELVDAIDQAQKTIDVAIYNISLPNVTDALIAAFERGVMVRMVMESEAMDGKAAERLLDTGIDLVGDYREGLMHHKFVIIDSQEVWTGSLNFTSTGVYNDFNNLVRIRSSRVAQNYSVEFNEMFVEGLFGPNSRANTPYPQVNVDGIPLEIYFSPDDGVTAQIVSEIAQASESIVFMAYAFTSDPIAEAMHQRAAAGVQVRGVFDESQYTSNQGGEYENLKQSGYDVKLDGISGLQHSKVIIIDGKTVITGSFNFSANAENNNDENIIIIYDAGLAGQYLQAFEPVYASGK
jgi:phosphatidylserine/phosphatidylglycerophosphate/cardiolipin synthase-like enzyme